MANEQVAVKKALGLIARNSYEISSLAQLVLCFPGMLQVGGGYAVL